MCPMRAAQSHATPPSHRLPVLDSDTTRAVGNFVNLARTRPLLSMLLPQISRSPGGTGVCLVQLRAPFVPRVPGRLAASAGGVGRERLRVEAGRVGAWLGGERLGRGSRALHTQSVELCERKMGPGWESLKEEGEANRLETPPGADGKRSNSRVGGAPGLSPGEVSCRRTRAWYFPKMC